MFERFSFRLQLQIEGVQFLAEAVEGETQVDAFVVDGEITRAGEEGLPHFGPIDLLREPSMLGRDDSGLAF